MHKYMDDTTLTTPVQKGSSGSMQSYVNQAVSSSTTNKMIPNVDKTKDMIISFHKQPIVIPPITLEGVEIERVKSVKLLGIIVTDKVTEWKHNLHLLQSFQAIIPSKTAAQGWAWQCWPARVLWICNQASAWICMSCMAYLTGCSWLCQNRIDSEKSHANDRTRVELWSGMFQTSPGENFFSEGEFCLGNFSLPSSPHHTNYTMYYPNRSPLDTPSVIHQNYPSRKPIPTGLRTLWYPMVYFITNNYILLTPFRVLFRYHKIVGERR